MKKRMFAAVLIIVVMIFNGTFIVSFGETGNEKNSTEYGEYFDLFMKFVLDKYGSNVSKEQLLSGAFKGMVESLDNYCEFFTKEEAADFFTELEGNYAGVGLYISDKYESSIFVGGVIEGSPAQSAGIIEGDRLVNVDGANIEGKTAKEVSGLIKGKIGTQVTLAIERGKTVRNFTVVRNEITINPVRYRIEGDVGYIILDEFNYNSNKAMDNAFSFMDKNGISKIIIDLRNNPGGEVSQVANIAKKLVPKGLITSLKFAETSEEDQNFYSDLEKLKYRLVLIVNKYSASASEVLAGAVQDTKAGTIVGTVTYGKSKVQKLFPIINNDKLKEIQKGAKVETLNAFDIGEAELNNKEDDSIFGWVKLTVGEYFTPNGRRIDHVGIQPDIFVEDQNEGENPNFMDIKYLKKNSKYFLNDEGEEVCAIEKILKIAGYDVSLPDGYYDEKTVKAMSKFQESVGLYPYGKADFVTQEFLNQELGKYCKNMDVQYAKALEILSK